MSDTPVEVQFTSAGCLNYPCRTPDLAKLRAVEPDRLFGRAPTGQAPDGAYFQALPAILMEFTQGRLVATDFAARAVAAQTRT